MLLSSSESGPIQPPETRLMRVALVGPPQACARLRAEVAGTFEVVGAFADLASARAAAPDADAFLVAAETHRSRVAEAGRIRAAEAGRIQDDLVELVEPLTERETQVLELLAEGLSNKGIGARLGISDQTVKFHVASICGKLDAHTRTEAVRRAVRRGLITL